MDHDKALEVVKDAWPRCGMRAGNNTARCNEFSVRKLIWPTGGSVFLCEKHRNDLLVTDYMQSVERPAH